MCTARQTEINNFPDARDDYMFGVRGCKEAGIAWPFGKLALLSMAELTEPEEEDRMKNNEEKKSEEMDILGKFGEMSVMEKTELTTDSDYYRVIVGNTWGNLAEDFEFYWRHEWAKYMAGLHEDPKDTAGGGYAGRGVVRKLSVESLLN